MPDQQEDLHPVLYWFLVIFCGTLIWGFFNLLLNGALGWGTYLIVALGYTAYMAYKWMKHQHSE